MTQHPRRPETASTHGTAPRRARSMRWDRPSQLLLEAVLMLFMLLTLVLVAIESVSAFAQREIVLPVTLVEDTTESEPGATIHTSEGTLTLTDPTTAQLLFDAVPRLLGAATVLGASYCLYRVVRSLRRGAPFHRANVRRLTAAALTVLFGGLAAGLAATFRTIELTTNAQDLLNDGTALVAGAALPLWPIALGLLLLCLAEFFRRGTALAEDVEGLV